MFCHFFVSLFASLNVCGEKKNLSLFFGESIFFYSNIKSLNESVVNAHYSTRVEKITNNVPRCCCCSKLHHFGTTFESRKEKKL